MTAPLNTPRTPPYKLAGLVLTLITIAAVVRCTSSSAVTFSSATS